MAHALNLTLKIRQDASAKATLAKIKASFAAEIQNKIDEALKESELVHFARVLVIDDLYLQVITEYDGDHQAYTDFFRKKLPDVFALLFSLAEKPIDPAALADSDKFFQFSAGLQVKALGEDPGGARDSNGQTAGYLFSAYGAREVKEIKAALSS
ncbi:MAG: hypothetical protein ACRYG8_22065 [Janthinobacterium lividum]